MSALNNSGLSREDQNKFFQLASQMTDGQQFKLLSLIKGQSKNLAILWSLVEKKSDFLSHGGDPNELIRKESTMLGI